MSTINVGINGFGRIGKCCFLQLLEDNSVLIKAININKLLLSKINNIYRIIRSFFNISKINITH